jgi:hypothetical protein
MNIRVAIRACAALACIGVLAPAQEDRIDIKVLYAGAPESRRTQDFTDFLGKTFKEVGTVELTKLEEKAKDFDVVIVDSPSPYGRGEGPRKFEMYETPKLTTGFTKPTILMGAAGGSVLGPLEIKLNWL